MLREVTTITIDRNETGDTLRLTQVTERDRVRDRAQLKVNSEKLKVVRDTVYVEKRDSVLVQDSRFTGQGSGEKKSGFLTYVKWIFFLLVALTGLIITAKVCLRR